jgi:hypothetical protein
MSKQEIMDVIVGCTEKLKHVPTLAEILEMTQVSHLQIRTHFGGYLSALRACNLESRESGRGAKKMAGVSAGGAGAEESIATIARLSDEPFAIG